MVPRTTTNLRVYDISRLPPPLTVIRADVIKRGVSTHAPQFQKQGIIRFPEIAAQPIVAVNASCSPIQPR